jgi:Kef-type K+ transport system membrane component KefB
MSSEFLSSVEFQMSLLLFVAIGGYLLASKINQSAIVGEILLGIIIGPSLFGLITYTAFVRSIATLGAAILLFVVGLEFQLKDIFKIKYGLIAFLGVIIPWIGGFLISKLFGYDFGSAVFVGTALTATSIAITANVLREMGKLKTEAAKTIIGAAVIDDVLSLVALSFSKQLISGDFSFGSTSLTVIKAILFLAIGIFVGYKYISRLIFKIDRTSFAKKYPEFVFMFAMMIAFLYAMIAEYLGLSAIVGAFVAGVSLEGIPIRNSKNYKEGAEYLHIIFASVFFVSLGVLVDFGAVTWKILFFLIVLTLVAVATKFIGCYIPARLQGMSKDDSRIIGFGMSPRGEVAMIVALIGLDAGLIKQDIYTALVIMALLTTIITPLVLRNWLYRKERIF